ncbi:Flagellin FlaG [Shewanella piezotolerans WP3]|uniref:Flagellin FlaG n=1 Tax=Shewanella piezotolerans (strain WP3 / JCM 13877) TaxID=225849 RepID=B8CKX1_SHEPW|nr:flagellar protein FlaG [Shewanella piezotolerans]ACJ28297.1 Flagellin FlaG [Shewanella piezotolerans WP3]
MELNLTSNNVAPTVVDTNINQNGLVNQDKGSANALARTETVNKIQDGNTVNAQEQLSEELAQEKIQEEKAAESPEEMEEVAEKLSDMMAMLRKGLTFKIDDSLGTQVVSVLDIDTGELIRQIPNEEALELAIKLHEKMAEMDGLLMSTEV